MWIFRSRSAGSTGLDDSRFCLMQLLILWPRKELKCTVILMITLWSPQSPKPIKAVYVTIDFCVILIISDLV